jgi:hypothetical protein
VVYFEHISGFEKDDMWFPTAQKHEGKRGRGKKSKGIWKRRISKKILSLFHNPSLPFNLNLKRKTYLKAYMGLIIKCMSSLIHFTPLKPFEILHY